MHDDGRAVRLLRDTPFALLLSARTVAMLAISFAPVALAFGILDLPGATASTLSVVLASEAIVLVMFTLVGGVVADRFSRPRVLVAAEALNAAAHAALAAMLLTGRAPVWGLAAAAAVSGAGSAMVWPALTGIIPDVVPADRLQQGNALVSLGGNIARVAGLVAGGAVVVAIGGGWALAVAAVMFSAAGVLTALLTRGVSAGLRHAVHHPPAKPGSPSRPTVLTDLRDGWQEFRSRQWLWVVVLQFSFLVLVWQAAHGVLGPVVAKHELGGAGAWTAVLTGEAVGLVLGVVPGDAGAAATAHPRRHPAVVRCGAALPAPRPRRATVERRGSGLCHGRVLRHVRDPLADDHAAQRALGGAVPGQLLRRPGLADARPIGLMLAGPAAAVFGPHPSLVACGVVMALTTVAALCAPEVRGLVAPPVSPTAVAAASRAPAPHGSGLLSEGGHHRGR